MMMHSFKVNKKMDLNKKIRNDWGEFARQSKNILNNKKKFNKMML